MDWLIKKIYLFVYINIIWGVLIEDSNLKSACLDKIFGVFENWDLKDLEDAYNVMNMPQVEWWNRVLYWTGLEPKEYKNEKGKKDYHFKFKGRNVYCSFSDDIANGAKGSAPKLDFYERIGPGDNEEDYKKIDKEGAPKFGFDAVLRNLIKEKKDSS